MRARNAAASISMPVKWRELTSALKKKNAKALFFTPGLSIKRIKRVGDLFADVLKLKQTLPAEFVKALSSGPPPKLRNWPRNTAKTSSVSSGPPDWRTMGKGPPDGRTMGRDKSLRE